MSVYTPEFLSDSDYTFNASALGMGGVLVYDDKPVLIPSIASVALAPTGGEGASVAENYDQHGISFTRAESRVIGYRTSDKYYTTYSDIYVTNLALFGRMSVAMMQATVTSTRNEDTDEADFELHAMYRGVEVDNREIMPRLDIDICSRSSYQQLTEAYLRRLGATAGSKCVDPRVERIRKGLERREPIRTSIVAGLEGRDGAAIQKNGDAPNVLRVEDFGKVFFGELLVKPGRRRVNLLRFEFNNGRHRSVDRNDADSNGGSHRGPQPQMQRQMLRRSIESPDSDFTPPPPSQPSPDSGTLTVGSGDGNGAPVWPNG